MVADSSIRSRIIFPLLAAQILSSAILLFALVFAAKNSVRESEKQFLESILRSSEQFLIRRSQSEVNQVLSSVGKPGSYYRISNAEGFEIIWPKDYFNPVWKSPPFATLNLIIGEGQIFSISVWKDASGFAPSVLGIIIVIGLLTIISFIFALRQLRMWEKDVRRLEGLLAVGQNGSTDRNKLNFEFFRRIFDMAAQARSWAYERQHKRMTVDSDNRLALMAAKMAHDMRGPLSALKISLDSPQPNQEALSLAISASGRLERLAEDLLRARRGERNEKTKGWLSVAELKEIIRGCESEIKILYPNFALQIYFDEESLHFGVTGEGLEWERILINLMLNTSEAVSSTGASIIRMDIRGILERDELKLTIEDNGPGVAANMLSAIGHVEFTTKDSGNGLGLVSIRQQMLSWGASMVADQGALGGLRLVFIIPSKHKDSYTPFP